VEPERTPEEGYHFTEDLTDPAIDWVRQQKALMADKPFFVYFAPAPPMPPTTSGPSGRPSTGAASTRAGTR
jgi:arylsulfatase A-like enzyme